MLWENTRKQKVEASGAVEGEDDFEIDVSTPSRMKYAQVGKQDNRNQFDALVAMIGGVKGRSAHKSQRQLSYKVSWRGYPEDENSWVTDEDVSSASELVKRFWYHNPDLYLDLGLTPKVVELPLSLLERENQPEEDVEEQNSNEATDDNVEDYEPAASENGSHFREPSEPSEPEMLQIQPRKRGRPSKTSSPPKKRGRGRPPKVSSPQRTNQAEESYVKSYDDTTHWDNHLKILGARESKDISEKADFKCQFDDDSIRIVGFEELVEKAPKSVSDFTTL
ncbi:hypothetical protein E3Q13_00354 [Wallemia mellicola]|nr:hypothetical protein E3Q13_00354 [Wallemia mellicola]TIC26326.1 hypothetical protein E3Q12_00354 [Wallemia mellicola]